MSQTYDVQAGAIGFRLALDTGQALPSGCTVTFYVKGVNDITPAKTFSGATNGTLVYRYTDGTEFPQTGTYLVQALVVIPAQSPAPQQTQHTAVQRVEVGPNLQ